MHTIKGLLSKYIVFYFSDVTPQRQNQPNPDSPPEYLELENSPAYSYADSTDVDYLSLNPVKDTNLLGKEECKTDDRIIMNPGKISNQYGSFPSGNIYI